MPILGYLRKKTLNPPLKYFYSYYLKRINRSYYCGLQHGLTSKTNKSIYKWSFNTMKKSLLLAGVACVLMANSASASWMDVAKNGKVYVGADYAFDSYDFRGNLDEAKNGHHSGMFNIGTRMDRIGFEVFGQWSAERTKDLADGKLKTKVNVYGLDLYGYQPMGCEGKYDIVATVGVADYNYSGKSDTGDSKSNHVGWRIGGGAMYNFNEHVSARIIGRYAYIGAGELNHTAEVTAGMRYTF